MKHSRRAPRLLVAAFLAAFAGLGGAVARAAEPTFAPAAVKSDFTLLYTTLQNAQYDPYAHTPKPVLDRAYAEALKAIDRPMRLIEVQTQFQMFVAKVKVAHTRLEFPAAAFDDYIKRGGRSFPVEIRIDDGRAFVIANNSGRADLGPGDEITRLDGRSMAVWIAYLSRRISADTPYLAHSLVEYRLAGLLWLDLGSVEGFDIEVRKPGGAKHRLRLPALTGTEQKAFAALHPKPFGLGDERVSRMLDGGVAYLRPGPFYNTDPAGNQWDNKAFGEFIDGAFQSFARAKARSLIVDLRNNPGGDAAFSDHLLTWIADRPYRFVSEFRIRASSATIASNRKRMAEAVAAGVPDAISPQFDALLARAPLGSSIAFPVAPVEPRHGQRFAGKAYVLIDRYCYSNCVNVAAVVQDYGFGTVMGEETTDLATTYGAMETFTLPNTGLSVGYAKALLIRPSGALTARGVVPDIPLRTPLVQSDDQVLKQALTIVRKGRSPVRHPAAPVH